MVNTWKPILAALVIFAAGVVTGGLTLRLAMPSRNPVTRAGLPPLGVRGEQRRDLLDRMARELYLGPDQRERIDQILRESQERTRLLWESIAPQARAEQRRVRERIREELQPDQRSKFDESFKMRGPGRFETHPREESKRPDDRRGLRPNRQGSSEKSPAPRQ